MSSETYPLKVKKIILNSEKFALRELPVDYLIDVENKVLENNLYETCLHGSDIPKEKLGVMGYSQLKAMYDDIMVLSYGEDWAKKPESEGDAKKN